MKSEPSAYSIDDLRRDGTELWDGVRNYQARNIMRDEIKVGDLALFYHSSTDVIGAAGEMEIVTEAYPDPTQFDQKDDHYDSKSKKEKPRWVCVDVKFLRKFKRTVPLQELRNDPFFEGMVLLKKGSRLSVQPVTEKHYKKIVTLGG